MKRKVNRVGRNTLTVSFPSKWAKKQNLKTGDEVGVKEEGDKLIISKESYFPIKKSVEIDVSGQDCMLHRIIAAIYKSGYDEVYIHYSSSNELKIIQERLERNLSEFDIVEYKHNLAIVKSISKLDSKQFDIIFKKIFYSINEIAKDIVKSLSSQDYDELNNIILRDKSIDKYTDFCRRLINKGFEIKFNRIPAIYYIIEQIEIIGDIYKDLCQHASSKKLKPDRLIIDLLKDVNHFLCFFIDILFKFDLNKIKKFGIEQKQIATNIESVYASINKRDLKLFFLINNIFHATFEMKSALMVEFI
ncbi:MAG: hypothetical protein U9R34_00835 [Nanoarchaeota archaeon]|nr:hypothetical protein [Nanoarchaeota archaeon]